MSDKTIDLDRSVHDLCRDHPRLKTTMANLGFDEITKPGRLQTMGRMMTIPKGCKVKGIDLDLVVNRLRNEGFEVIGAGVEPVAKPVAAPLSDGPVAGAADATAAAAGATPAAGAAQSVPVASTPEERQRILQHMLAQLSGGASVDEVKDVFKANFQDVDATEIAQAEQALINGGVPVEEVQRLCDVHATLFDGHVACAPSAKAEPSDVPGHPVWSFRQENRAFERLLADSVRPDTERADQLADGSQSPELAAALTSDIERLQKVSVHYKRKEELVFPFLERHGVHGPSKVMWGKDDEVRAGLATALSLAQGARQSPTASNLQSVARELASAADALESMITKEEQILLPLALEKLNAREWQRVHDDSDEYGFVLIDQPPAWRPSMMELAEAAVQETDLAGAGAADGTAGGVASAGSSGATGRGSVAAATGSAADRAMASEDGRIHLSTGSFTAAELEAVLNTIPLDITFVDKDDKTRYFSHGETRAFPRPMSCLGRDVYDCHPPKSQAMVRQVFDDFRSGARDSYEFWIHRGDAFLYIRYFAVRDSEGNYLGALETTQDVAPIQELEGDNRRGADIRREERERREAHGAHEERGATSRPSM